MSSLLAITMLMLLSGSSSFPTSPASRSGILRSTMDPPRDYDAAEVPPIKMIVFDKDGTLGDCTPALKLWCRRMTAQIESKCNRDATISNFHQAIGWDALNDDVMPSAPLSAGTWDEIVALTTASLISSGVDISHEEVLEWHRHLGDLHAEDVTLIEDMPRFLKYFKHHGIRIAICTSDDRSSTNACMKNWDIAHLVDYTLCGDEVEESKPSPWPLKELCRRSGISPHDCLVVGDTTSDTLMGLRAGAGIVVGVLTGSGTKDQLIKCGAHLVLPNIGYIKDLLLLSSEPSDVAKDPDVTISLDDNMSPVKVKA